jgi:hypothetical protein
MTRLIVLVISLTFASSLRAQEVTYRRIADLNPGGVGSFPINFTTFHDAAYFIDSDCFMHEAVPNLARKWRWHG